LTRARIRDRKRGFGTSAMGFFERGWKSMGKKEGQRGDSWGGGSCEFSLCRAGKAIQGTRLLLEKGSLRLRKIREKENGGYEGPLEKGGEWRVWRGQEKLKVKHGTPAKRREGTAEEEIASKADLTTADGKEAGRGRT